MVWITQVVCSLVFVAPPQILKNKRVLLISFLLLQLGNVLKFEPLNSGQTAYIKSQRCIQPTISEET